MRPILLKGHERCVPRPRSRAHATAPRRDARGPHPFSRRKVFAARQPEIAPPVEPMLTSRFAVLISQASDVHQVQQGGRPPVHVRQGSPPHTVVLRRRRARWHVHRPQRRRVDVRRVRGLQDLRHRFRGHHVQDVGHRDRDVLLHPPVRAARPRGGALPGRPATW